MANYITTEPVLAWWQKTLQRLPKIESVTQAVNSYSTLRETPSVYHKVDSLRSQTRLMTHFYLNRDVQAFSFRVFDQKVLPALTTVTFFHSPPPTSNHLRHSAPIKTFLTVQFLQSIISPSYIQLLLLTPHFHPLLAHVLPLISQIKIHAPKKIKFFNRYKFSLLLRCTLIYVE